MSMLVRALSRVVALLDYTDTFDVDSSPPIGWLESDTYDTLEAVSGILQANRTPPVSSSGSRSLNYLDREFVTDDQDVQAVSVSMLSGTTQTKYNTHIGLRGRQGEKTYAVVRFTRAGSSNSFGIDTVIADSSTARATQNRAVPAGSFVRLRAIGNVYTAYFNGVQVLQWIDTNNVYPTGPDYRRGLLRATSAKLNASAAYTFGPAWDNFNARDVGIRDPQRAILSNSQVITAANVWTILGAPLRADMTECPWTSINGIAAGTHAVVADGKGQSQVDVTINASGAAAATVTSVCVTVNGVVQGSTTVGAAGSKTITHSATVDVDLGDLIRVEVSTTGTSNAIRTLGGSATTRLSEFTVTPL